MLNIEIWLEGQNTAVDIIFDENKDKIKSFIKSNSIALLKKYLKLERKYWVDIFDNKPYRYRLVESDNWTMNIARIEIDRIDKELENLK